VKSWDATVRLPQGLIHITDLDRWYEKYHWII
jgi:hypothetical protein